MHLSCFLSEENFLTRFLSLGVAASVGIIVGGLIVCIFCTAALVCCCRNSFCKKPASSSSSGATTTTTTSASALMNGGPGSHHGSHHGSVHGSQHGSHHGNGHAQNHIDRGRLAPGLYIVFFYCLYVCIGRMNIVMLLYLKDPKFSPKCTNVS